MKGTDGHGSKKKWDVIDAVHSEVASDRKIFFFYIEELAVLFTWQAEVRGVLACTDSIS